MILKLLFSSICLCIVGCRNEAEKNNVKATVATTNEIYKEVNKHDTFELIKQFPVIKDTSVFIRQLLQAGGLETHESPEQQRLQKISYYKKVKLYGSNKIYILVEFDWGDGAMASYPWKCQLLFEDTGRLVHKFFAQRFELLQVFHGENSFLLTTIVTAKGNGGHELYKFSADTLENVYEGYYDYNFSTYDKHEDNTVYEPNELKLKISDINSDGFNDLIFYGMMVYIQGRTPKGEWFDCLEENGKRKCYSLSNPFKKVPIKCLFLYDKRSGHFKAKEDYNLKYKN